jgi:dimethylargininase
MTMKVTRALAREPAGNFASGLTTMTFAQPADYDLMRKQHRAYVEALQSLGLEVTVMPAEPDYPDAHFVEDTAVITREWAVVTRPGAGVRRGETDSVEAVLARYRPIRRIHAPGTLDGGDVLMVGSHFFIGLSERTNAGGADQLGRILESSGYTWSTLRVREGLHFKSSVNVVAPDTLLITQDFAAHPQLQAFKRIVVPPEEAYAANTLWVNEHLLSPAGYPRTLEKLAQTGFPVVELDTSEARKMDGGLTCLSLRF